MRDYKFRGMDIAGDWHYGNLAVITKKMGLTEPGYYISNAVGKPFAYMVRPETVGQYTGLKDRNGKEIYEGDIVEVLIMGGYCDHFVDKKHTKEVKYNESKACWMPFNECRMWQEDGKLLEVEVIGSIYDNPDLLEG